MTLSKILFMWFLGYSLAGCGGGPTPRLLDLVGKDVVPPREFRPENDEWMRASQIGLVVHSDATAPNAAPAIIPEYLQTLTRRTEEFLRQRCSFQEIVTVPPLSKPVNLSQDLKIQGQRLQVPYEMVVLFSSREQAGPEKIGEATMMTQMGGTVIENSAMAEGGILRASDFTMVFWASGLATENLEQLNVPIGTNRPRTVDAHDILRARAGQQALDRALEHVGPACQSVK
jgi:hypothetical protein